MKNKYLDKLNTLPLFDIPILKGLFPDIKPAYLLNYLNYWSKNQKVYRLSRGIYVAKDAYLTYKSNNSYREFIAGRLSYPSYLTGEYILSKHNILTEGVFSLTCATLKERKNAANILGTFIYTQIKKSLFNGYLTKNFLQYEFYEATKMKALFDYFYFRINLIDNRSLNHLAEDLRLNLDLIASDEIKEFKNYCQLAKNNKLLKISEVLKKYASA